MKLKYRLLVAFLFVAILSVGITGFYSLQRSRNALNDEVLRHLNSVAEMKSQQVQDYFDDIFQRAYVFSEMWFTQTLIKEFDQEFSNVNKSFSSLSKKGEEAEMQNELFLRKSLTDTIVDIPANLLRYQSLYRRYNADLNKYLNRTPFNDIYFVGLSGYVVFCSSANSLLGTRLVDNKQLSEQFKLALKKVQESNETELAFSDFHPFYINDNAPTAFVIKNIWQNGKKLGVVIFELSNTKLSQLMTFNGKWEECGLMKTGESFIIGPQLFMRSESRLYLENPDTLISHLNTIGYPKEVIQNITKHKSTVLNLRVLNEASMSAIKGDDFQGSYLDYLNNPVIGCAKPLKILDSKWGLIVKINEDEAFAKVNAVERFLVSVFLGTILFVIIVSIALSLQITKPLSLLSNKAKEISDGNFDPMLTISRRDEIGVLAKSFREMQQKIGNLIADLVSSKKSIEEKQQAIIDSVNYARKIQDGILTSSEYLNEILPEWFVYFNPRDIVSGDFYWAQRVTIENGKKSEAVFLAVCDSTGHGVPGAFMSLLNVNLIKEAIIERKIIQPAKILAYVRDALAATFPGEEYKDGMDGVLLLIEDEGKRITYSAAFNNPILVRNGESILLEADRLSVGKGGAVGTFTDHVIETQKGDLLYLLSDGYIDQFGGERDKKYKIKPFLSLLQSISHFPVNDQRDALSEEFEKWRGNEEQTDDVIVFGIKL